FGDVLLPLIWNTGDQSVDKYATEKAGAHGKNSLQYKEGVVVGSLGKDVIDLGNLVVKPINTLWDCATGKKDWGQANKEAQESFHKTADTVGQILSHPLDHMGALAALAISIKAVPGPSQMAALGRIAVMAEETEALTQAARVGQTLNNMN